jgi:hypothetical protein
MMFWTWHEHIIERYLIEIVQDRFQKNQLFNRYHRQEMCSTCPYDREK